MAARMFVWHIRTVAKWKIHSPKGLIGTPYYYCVWPPFAFRTALILCGIDSTRCWNHSLEMLAHIDRIASCSWWRFVGWISGAQSSRSTTSQRCSIGLRFGECGGHFSTVNSLSWSTNQFEMIRVLWHGSLFCLK